MAAGLVEGQPDRLLGYPVVEAEDMPDIAADALPDRVRQFQGRLSDRRAQRDQILRDPFTNKPFVHFYATKRVGGQVLDSEAIKLLKFERSLTRRDPAAVLRRLRPPRCDPVAAACGGAFPAFRAWTRAIRAEHAGTDRRATRSRARIIAPPTLRPRR